MLPTEQGSWRLFDALGVRVYLHWSWFLIAAIQVGTPQAAEMFSDWLFHIGWYLSLFAIVLLHEYGHALACKSVGGRADKIVLWPLGGVAYVQPPPRPLATLWSIAAGPLVNVALVPVTLGLMWTAGGSVESLNAGSDWQRFTFVLFATNLGLLIFNILPVFPLDGGQMLQAILWLFMGRARSLAVASGTGIVFASAGAAAVILFRLDWWLLIMAIFIGWQSFTGYVYARRLAAYERYERAWGVDPFDGR